MPGSSRRAHRFRATGPCSLDRIAAPALRLCAKVLLATAATLAAASEDPPSALSTLARTGAVACRPTLPYFCSNTHVSCSGRTAIRTFAFKLRVNARQGWIEPESDPSGIAPHYTSLSADRNDAEGYVIVRPQGANGYIRLLADGRYSFRHYSRDGGAMSHGHCR